MNQTPQGFETKVTALADGFGCRILRNGKTVSEGHAKTKGDIAPTIREMLRMLDKCGDPLGGSPHLSRPSEVAHENR